MAIVNINKHLEKNSRYQALKDIFIPIEDSLPERELKRAVRHYAQYGKEAFLPIGTRAPYLFSYTTFLMLYIDDAVEAIAGISKKELMGKPIYDSVSRSIVPEHVYATVRLSEYSFRYLCAHAQDEVVICQEYNIITPSKEKKRLLYQYKVVSRNTSGIPLLAYGHLTDFTHIVASGPPRLSIVVNGHLKEVLHSMPEEILAGIEIPLTHKELSVLLLKQKGLRTKEIAATLRMKELSIYSIIRDIKRKAGMDILPLIHLLEEKGAIQP